MAKAAARPFLPVTIRGEMPGRAMRGSAEAARFSFQNHAMKVSARSLQNAAPPLIRPSGTFSP
ncbi:MAG: hypothetical protein E5W93_13490 [Mesorhizobium sp.]|nr:MAG: hypothetical protein E5W93_13490 [Mesorhizobium sp.]